MGWKLNAILFLVMLFALGAGALFIGVPILLYFIYKLWSGRSRPGTGGSHKAIYVGGFFFILALVAVGQGGTWSPVVFGGSGLLLMAWGLFPNSVHGSFDLVRSSISVALGGLRKQSWRADVGPCVELTRMPLKHLNAKKEEDKERLTRFQRLAQTLAETGEGVEFRMDFASGSGRAAFCVGGRDADRRTDELLLLLRAQLPEFGPRRATMSRATEDWCSVSVEGAPEPSADPVGPLAKFFVENRLSGRYSVTISPASVNRVSRWLAGRDQRKVAVASQFQHVDDDRTTTEVDHLKQVELGESVKRLERLSARTPINVLVKVYAEETTAIQAAHVLTGSLSSQRMIDGLKVGRPRLANRPGWQRYTMMLPSEAAPLLWIPQHSLGMEVAPSAEFQAPHVTEGEIVLGDVVSLSGKTGHQVRVGLGQLAKHIFVTGMTGSGKTTSCFSLLLQLQRLKVPFLVVEPVKSEYRSLLATIPDLQVFTIGDEQTAPFRLNIFEPPPGVKVQAHLENLEAVWNASFVSYAPLPYVIKEVFARTYEACGWDIANNTRGRPVGFEDVRLQVERVVRRLGYERDVTMNVEAALKTRLTSLTLGGKGPLFATENSTPLEEILSQPTVIELKDVQNDEEKAFVAALLLSNIASYAQARGLSKHLRHFTLIEEAHRLMPNVSTEKGDPESADPRRRVVEQFGNMLAELRAYGEGLAVVEQIPTKILPDAIKNTATKVVHRVPALDDRRAMAGTMNATKEQAAVFTALKPGEAILGLEGHPVPVRVEVEDVVARLGVPAGEVTDANVRERMAEFYRSNPLPKAEPRTEDSMRELVGSEQFGKELQEAYRLWIRTGRIAPLEELVLRSAGRFTSTGDDQVKEAVRILSLGTALHLPLDEEDRALLPRVVERDIRRSMKDGRAP